jgi:hypothetical protein
MRACRLAQNGVNMRYVHRSVHLFIVFIAMVPLGIAQPVHENSQAVVSQQEARELIYKALPSSTVHLPGFGLDNMNAPNFPDFYFFEGLWDNPDGSAVSGHYAVDKKTGDVWNGVVCRQFVSRSLRKAQHALRKSIGLSEQEYQRIKRPGPMC